MIKNILLFSAAVLARSWFEDLCGEQGAHYHLSYNWSGTTYIVAEILPLINKNGRRVPRLGTLDGRKVLEIRPSNNPSFSDCARQKTESLVDDSTDEAPKTGDPFPLLVSAKWKPLQPHSDTDRASAPAPVVQFALFVVDDADTTLRCKAHQSRSRNSKKQTQVKRVTRSRFQLISPSFPSTYKQWRTANLKTPDLLNEIFDS